MYNSQPKPLPMYKKQYHICDVLLHHFEHTHTSHHQQLPTIITYTFLSELCLPFISFLLNCSTLHPDTLHQHTTTPNKNGFHMKHLMLNPKYLLLVMTATCTQNTLYFQYLNIDYVVRRHCLCRQRMFSLDTFKQYNSHCIDVFLFRSISIQIQIMKDI